MVVYFRRRDFRHERQTYATFIYLHYLRIRTDLQKYYIDFAVENGDAPSLPVIESNHEEHKPQPHGEDKRAAVFDVSSHVG